MSETVIALYFSLSHLVKNETEIKARNEIDCRIVSFHSFSANRIELYYAANRMAKENFDTKLHFVANGNTFSKNYYPTNIASIHSFI